MADKKPDPTKDPEFQKIVHHFLTTPPQPHKFGKERKAPKGRKHASAKSKTA